MIEINDVGKRLDVYVAERGNITRSASAKLAERGAVRVNGIKMPKNYRLRENDTVYIEFPEPVPDRALPEDIPLDIVYEDASLLVVNKQKGMVVHPAAGNPDGTLVNALLFHCGSSLSGINGVIRPGIVHRIDKDTSGLLVVAKTDAAHLSLAEQISSHSFERHYHAIVNGHLSEEKGTVNAPIGRHPVERKKMAVVGNGKNAVTHYSVISRLNKADYVMLRLETGRTHQIRVHMASLGHPLLGDAVYGGGKSGFETSHAALIRGQCLHAKSISFLHPETGELMKFDSALPDYFLECLRLLGGEQERGSF